MKRRDVFWFIRGLFERAGIVPPEDYIFDGQYKSYAALDDKPGKKSAWGVLNIQERVLVLGSHKTGETHRLKLSQKNMNILLRDNIKTKLTSGVSKQVLKERVQKFAAQISQRYVKRLNSAVGSEHRYSVNKGFILYPDTYLDGDRIVIPMYFLGELCSYQTIDENGLKMFKKGGRLKGCYHQIGDLTEQAYIAEGYATGATLHDATGCCVFICFTANNILLVTQALLKAHPQVGFIIAADNDHLTKGNPGLTKAMEASQLTGVPYTHPVFPVGYGGTDFNDLAALLRTQEGGGNE